MTTETTKGKAPSHSGYIVENYGTGKAYWTKVAAVFAHEDGQGFNVVLKPGLGITGPLVIRPVKERKTRET